MMIPVSPFQKLPALVLQPDDLQRLSTRFRHICATLAPSGDLQALPQDQATAVARILMVLERFPELSERDIFLACLGIVSPQQAIEPIIEPPQIIHVV